MLPNPLPFKVVLYLGHGDKSYPMALHNFCTKEADATIDPTYLREFTYVNLEFKPTPGESVPDQARLYLEGLDGVSSDKINYDLDGAYLNCPCDVALYNHVENYPWIPGQYRVKVVWGERVFYTILRVKAKHMEDRQLEIMRQELEDCVAGLAIDVALPRLGLGAAQKVQWLPQRFYQYKLLEKEFPRLYATILDILQRPHQQSVKEHHVVPQHKAKVWDSQTIYWLNSRHSLRKNVNISHRQLDYVLVPRSDINFNLPENQWIKKILMDFVQVCGEIQKAIETTVLDKEDQLAEDSKFYAAQVGLLARKQQEIQRLRHDLQRCNQLQGRMWQLLNLPFFKNIKSRAGYVPVTLGLQRDFRYLNVFKFWQQMFQRSKIHVRSAVDYQWKRTDLLYEYWVFVKTIEMLQELGFSPVQGWIFSHDWGSGELNFIPSIEPGLKVVFEKEKWRLDLIYNQDVPYDAKTATAKGIPVWSEYENNKPDLRLDIYEHQTYVQSFIFEVKYRRLNSIWNTALEGDRRQWTENMRQLRNYRLGLSNVADYRVRPVDEVVVFYPGDNTGAYYDAPIINNDAFRVTLVQLRPGEDQRHVLKYLKHNLFTWEQ